MVSWWNSETYTCIKLVLTYNSHYYSFPTRYVGDLPFSNTQLQIFDYNVLSNCTYENECLSFKKYSFS